MSEKVDLHTHTYYSDGALSPRELVTRADEVGITTLSITDHDSVECLTEAVETSKEFGIEILTGVELSATLGTKDIHILGYMFDPENKQLRTVLNIFRQERFKRAERIVAKLNKLDLPISFNTVVELAGCGAIGRPHIATALVDEGLSTTYSEAFESYLGETCPAYEPKYRISPEDAVEFIADAGGLSILAHPGWYVSDDDLLLLIRAGLDGIETIHPGHTEDRIRFFRGIASTYFLLESGGSDFHGGKRNDYLNFGTYVVSKDIVQAMKRRLFIQ